MPSFEIEFEVFCGTCGEGLCLQSQGRNSYRRGYPQVVVNVCESCLNNLRAELEETIAELREELLEMEKERTG